MIIVWAHADANSKNMKNNFGVIKYLITNKNGQNIIKMDIVYNVSHIINNSFEIKLSYFILLIQVLTSHSILKNRKKKKIIQTISIMQKLI